MSSKLQLTSISAVVSLCAGIGIVLGGLTTLRAGDADPRRPGSLISPHGQPVPQVDPATVKVELPPLPEGVEELNFKDFFKMPVGERGLELTDRLKALDGKRVRLVGYMVYEDLTRCNSCVAPKTAGGRPIPAWMEATVPGRMMLTSRPAMVSFSHYGLADDLPPQTVFVTVAEKIGQLVPFTPGPMLLTGTLSVGSKKEMDGRVSLVRLELDPPASTPLASGESAAPQPISR